MSLNKLGADAHRMAIEKGWYDSDTPRPVPELIALIHSEVSEALEEFRAGRMTTWVGDKGKPEGLPVELADVVIRLVDMAAYLGIDLDAAVEQKMQYNATRPYRHGGKKC